MTTPAEQYQVGPWIENYEACRQLRGTWSTAADAPAQFATARLGEAYAAHYSAEQLGHVLAVIQRGMAAGEMAGAVHQAIDIYLHRGEAPKGHSPGIDPEQLLKLAEARLADDGVTLGWPMMLHIIADLRRLRSYVGAPQQAAALREYCASQHPDHGCRNHLLREAARLSLQSEGVVGHE